jgi:hypothetical protein
MARLWMFWSPPIYISGPTQHEVQGNKERRYDDEVSPMSPCAIPTDATCFGPWASLHPDLSSCLQ